MKQPDPVIAEPEQVRPDELHACDLCSTREVYFLFESLLAACMPLRRALGRGGAVHVTASKVPA